MDTLINHLGVRERALGVLYSPLRSAGAAAASQTALRSVEAARRELIEKRDAMPPGTLGRPELERMIDQLDAEVAERSNNRDCSRTPS